MDKLHSVTSTLLLLAFLGSAVHAQSPPASRGPSYVVTDVHARVVTEIKDPSMGTRRAENGAIVEIAALVAPEGTETPLDISQIKLTGEQADGGTKVSWTFSPIGVGMSVGGKCSYLFFDSLVTGEIGRSQNEAGEFSVSRAAENGPAMLTVKKHTHLCLAFPTPAEPSGSVKLRFGGAENAAPLTATAR